MYPDCLSGFVGIGDLGCGSYKIADDKSSSGLFVTQDPAYNNARFRSGDSDCDLAKLLIEMREEAYRQLTSDIGAVLSSKIQTKSDSLYDIGQPDTGPYLASSVVPAVPTINIQTDYREGAFVEIRRIALMLVSFNNVPTNVEMRVKKGDQLLKAYTIVVSTQSKVLKPVDPVRLPCDGSLYTVEYTYDSAAFIVPESFYHCGCGDKLKNAAGFIQEQKSNDSRRVQSYGMHMQVNLGCDAGLVICSLLKNSVYRNVLAFMVRQKVIDLTLNRIFGRQEVNKFTLLSEEDLSAQAALYQAQYNERLRWFSYEKDFEVDGFCISCSGSGMRKVSMLTGR